ncbi:CST complex subunit Ten1 [Phyllosticta capitalensis]
MSTGPPPSQLILLSDLGSMEKGTKVRFLGCVERYDVASGVLLVKHAYPLGAPIQVAHVDVKLALETLWHTDLQTGAWLNITGYVGEEARRVRRQRGVCVQAVMVRPAGELKLSEYEQALDARKVCDILYQRA